tara:strand:- start:11558 stop:11782 length:225 start_codon:yes stop_codon:yes gene_type:complete
MEVKDSKIDEAELVLLKLGTEEDMYLNRLDSIIEYLSEFQGLEEEMEGDYFLNPLVTKLIEARMFYLAWSEGGY